MNYDTGFMEWFECILPMRDPWSLTSEEFDNMVDSLLIQTEDELFGEDWLDNYATEILDAKYNFTSIRDVVNQLKHLSQKQKDNLHKILTKHEKLFDGTLGVYPHKKFHIDIEEDATPVRNLILYQEYISKLSRKN